MAENYLITGYHGTPHVTAENDRGINAGVFGTGRFVLPVGEQFRAENIGNNTIRMYDGKLIDNGAAAGIPAGEYIDFVIPTGTQGLNRIDLIVFDYRKNSSTMIETGTFEVISGTETSGTPEAPSLTRNNLLSGSASVDQMGLWSVTVTNGAITDISCVFSVRNPVSTAGDTMDGYLYFEKELNEKNYKGYVGVSLETGNMLVGHYTDGEADNYMALSASNTNFKKPVGVGSGGTGATTAAEARTNLGITPENIGAAKTEHGTHVTFATGTPKAPGTGSAGSANTVARSDHEHPKQTEVSGNSGTTTKLKTARTIQTNLASGDAVEFDGSKNVTPGVKGILPMANGGTGSSSLLDAPDNAIVKKLKEGSQLWYTATGNGAFYATAKNGAAKFGTLPLAQGGVGTPNLVDAPVHAIIRKANTDDSESLWYTETNNGAFYATEANGAPRFGTLPIEQGGTGATSADGVKKKLGIGAAAAFDTLPMANGGTGSANLGEAPVNAIVRKANSDSGDSLWYTPTAKGAAYVTAENGQFQFGALPLSYGGTGNDTMGNAPAYSVIRMNSSGDKMWYTPTAKGAAYATKDNGELLFNTLPLDCGGTGSGNLGDAPANAIIRKISSEGLNQMWYTPTAKGAFYASKANGIPSFGTLPIEMGGTGATKAEDALTKLGAAPSGYGVGGTAKDITGSSILTVLRGGKSGKYRGSSVGNAPDSGYWYFEVICTSTTYGVVNAYSYGTANTHCRTVFRDGALEEWEYDNPPMVSGVEYKTTKRRGGSAIYAKRVTYTNTSAIGDASTYTDISIQHGISNFGTINGLFARCGTYILPISFGGSGLTSVYRVTAQDIILRLNKSTSSANNSWTFDLEYTKSS